MPLDLLVLGVGLPGVLLAMWAGIVLTAYFDTERKGENENE
jgi:hypothetical protein